MYPELLKEAVKKQLAKMLRARPTPMLKAPSIPPGRTLEGRARGALTGALSAGSIKPKGGLAGLPKKAMSPIKSPIANVQKNLKSMTKSFSQKGGNSLQGAVKPVKGVTPVSYNPNTSYRGNQ